MKKTFGLIAVVLVVSLFVTQSVASEEPLPMTITDLGLGDYSTAADVNENNQVVGWYTPPFVPSPLHAFLWAEADGLTDLGPGMALTINDLGHVAGYTSNDDPDIPDHAFVWSEDTGIIDIESLNPSWTSWAFDSNNQGQVVGCYEMGEPCDGEWWCLVPYWDGAFLWTQETGMVDLNVQTEEPLKCAYDINEYGQIVGESQNGPFLLNPDGEIQYMELPRFSGHIAA